jgi:phosphatidyl-myo-inositol dimannoside synthase
VKNVIFTGEAPEAELLDYYRTADVFVMPNRTINNGDTEGFGIVFLEAGACGKPVIGGRDGGVPDAVANGETGLLVDGNSVSEIANAAIRLLSNQELCATLGRAGLERARCCSWDRKAEEFHRLCLKTVQATVRARKE